MNRIKKAYKIITTATLCTTSLISTAFASSGAITLDSVTDLIAQFVLIGGGFCAVWGIIVLASALPDHNGPQQQIGIWRIVGGLLIISAGALFKYIA